MKLAALQSDQAQTPLVQQLRELSSESFLAVMTSIYEVLLNIIEQLQKVNDQMEVVLRQQQQNGEETSILFSKVSFLHKPCVIPFFSFLER